MTLVKNKKSSPTGLRADAAADTRLLAQGPDDRVQVLDHRDREHLGLPDVVLTVDGNTEVTARHLGHSHSTVQHRARRVGRPRGPSARKPTRRSKNSNGFLPRIGV